MNQFETLHNCYILATLSYLPFLFLGLFKIIQDKNLIIRAPNLKINYAFSQWDATNKYTTAIWIGVFSFLMLAAAKHMFREIETISLSTGPILLTISGTIALSIEHFKLSETYENHSKTIKTILVFSAVAVGYIASTTTNTSIAEYTHTNASNFPDAQRLITTLVSIGVWLYAAVIISFIAYTMICAITVFKMISNDLQSTRERRYTKCLIGSPPKRNKPKSIEIITLTSLLMGTSMTVSIPLAYLKVLKVSSVENATKYLLVKTSFQLSPELCGVQTPPDSSMSLLPFRQAAIAVPVDKTGYQFSIIECNRTFDTFPKLETARTEYTIKANKQQE